MNFNFSYIFLPSFELWKLTYVDCFELKQSDFIYLFFFFFGASFVAKFNVDYICKLIMFNFFFFGFMECVDLRKCAEKI